MHKLAKRGDIARALLHFFKLIQEHSIRWQASPLSANTALYFVSGRQMRPQQRGRRGFTSSTTRSRCKAESASGCDGLGPSCFPLPPIHTEAKATPSATCLPCLGSLIGAACLPPAPAPQPQSGSLNGAAACAPVNCSAAIRGRGR